MNDPGLDDPIELLSLTADQVAAVQRFQKDLAEIVRLLADCVATMHESTITQTAAINAALDQPKPAPDPIPPSVLSSVVSALTAILRRIDTLQNTVDAMERRTQVGTTISYDDYGMPSKIRRDDGTEFSIQRDLNRRTIRFQPRN